MNVRKKERERKKVRQKEINRARVISQIEVDCGMTKPSISYPAR